MFDFLYETGWGAFSIMLFFQIPFVIVFLSIVYKKAFVNPAPSETEGRKLSRIETAWIGSAVALFVLVNVFSIGYMPMVATAEAKATHQSFQEVDVTAQSWFFDMSTREVEAGQPVRFTARSADTMHSFSVYHPDGKVEFTMQLLPGMDTPAENIHTFSEPGTYKIRCLEYCGIAHHGMQDELVVVKANG